ncbi:MAG: dihydroorotase [Bacteroidota bacterium]
MLIRNATIVNEGKQFVADVHIRNGRIEKIGSNLSIREKVIEIEATGKHLFPGAIDDQVHFREPGLTHKGEIYTEAKAAVAGGITSFMEMPNTIPNVFTQELLEDKFQIAARTSLANYSFFIGASNDNAEVVLKTNRKNVAGIKIFMGSSTGNMLVDNPSTLEFLFSRSELLIATHCEDEATIRRNLEQYKSQYGENIPVSCHPLIRSAEACYLSSSMAVELAKKHGTRLNILHISTAKELELFRNDIPLKDKKITAEACIHHLWFDDGDYERLGNFIKWNPAIKTKHDKEEIFKALLDDRIDILATDHAPHTMEEKSQSYLKAPSGGPLVQHAFVAMLEFYHRGMISLEKIAEKMAHHPAICYMVEDRGFIREGYHADLVLIDLNSPWKVEKSNLLYKCNWSPFEGETFNAKVTHTIVSGHLAYEHGSFHEEQKGQRLLFTR